MAIDLKELNKKRRFVADISDKDDGKDVLVAGWVYDSRDLGKIRFIVLRDYSGEIQITGFNKDVSEEIFEAMDGINRESVVVIRGKVKKSKQAPGGREIVPESLEVMSEAEQPLPVDVSDFSKTELPKRLDYRFLDFHRRKTHAIFKIQSTIIEAFREHFSKNGFMEMQPPCIISSSSEGGTELFEAKYFEKKAYLAQSPQLYKQMLACSVERVFATMPVWRAEKHNTTRHINEIRQMDIEVGFAGQFEVMKHLEESVKHMVSKVMEKNKPELELLGVTLKVPGSVYMSFDECKGLLEKKGIKISDDLTPEAEKLLGKIYPDTIVFVHTWPAESKPFYIMPQGGDAGAELSEGFDAIYKGLEISSGGQRIHLPDLLTEMLKKKSLKPKDFKDYIDSFRYGAPPHAGWSIGLERMTILLCGLDNIREGTMFPRDRDRLSP